jgi:TatD DNase family protein
MSSKSKPPIPLFDRPIVETHCHLDYLTDQDVATTIAEARSVGVDRIITIAVSADNQARVRDLVTSQDEVYGTQGIHPHEADSWNNSLAAEISAACNNPRIVALGEMGLDYYYEHADRKTQQVAFRAQLELAEKLNRPVVIHTRDADGDTRDMLSEFSGRLPRGGVIHSFTSSIELAEFCIAEGFMLGFNGITTFKNADNVRAVVDITPLDRILLETDAPYLTPVPYRGQRNAPRYLPFIAEQVANIKGVPVNALLEQVYDNSYQLFF